MDFRWLSVGLKIIKYILLAKNCAFSRPANSVLVIKNWKGS